MPRVSGTPSTTLSAKLEPLDAKKLELPKGLTPLAPIELPLHPGLEPGVGRGGSKRSRPLGQSESGAISISSSGRLLVGGKLPSDAPGVGADVSARVAAAKLASATGGVFASAKLDAATEAKTLSALLAGLERAPKLKGVARAELESATASLLIDLASAAPTGKRFTACASAALEAIARLPDREMAAFYLFGASTLLGPRLTQALGARLGELKASLMPSRPPVEAWTEDRKKPLVVRHTVHPEFWKEELTFFSKKNGFTLTHKNAKDTERSYTGLLEDPEGKRPALKVELTIKKDELDYLESIGDPKVHVILYSGHSALGGNGAQAIDAAGAMKGPHPKLVMAANCRGKDNYASFTNKYPDAHVIMTDMPTYSVSGQARIEALFDTLARGGDYQSMRQKSEVAAWDEPANNYFYPDEWRKFRFMDADGDGKADGIGGLLDRYFDPGRRATADKFVRAVNFLNSELFYHWEVDHENGKKSYFGKEYGDGVLADGAAPGPLPEDRLVKITPLAMKVNGKTMERWRVQYDPSKGAGLDENVYAAKLTMQSVLSLTALKKPTLGLDDALRAVLMGAQGIHYMDVYEDTNPLHQRQFFKQIGLHPKIEAKDVDQIFEKFDAHASGKQIDALKELLTEKYGVDLAAWLPGFLAKNA